MHRAAAGYMPDVRGVLSKFVRFLLVTAAAGLLFTSCDAPGGGASSTDEPVDTDRGRELFKTSCRSCHSLADADAAGVFGPDLDALQPDEERVREQIERGGGGMPSNILEGDDADLVAAYVAQVAADPQEGDPSQPGGSTG